MTKSELEERIAKLEEKNKDAFLVDDKDEVVAFYAGQLKILREWLETK
jgi:hypothetical protein